MSHWNTNNDLIHDIQALSLFNDEVSSDINSLKDADKVLSAKVNQRTGKSLFNDDISYSESSEVCSDSDIENVEYCAVGRGRSLKGKPLRNKIGVSEGSFPHNHDKLSDLPKHHRYEYSDSSIRNHLQTTKTEPRKANSLHYPLSDHVNLRLGNIKLGENSVGRSSTSTSTTSDEGSDSSTSKAARDLQEMTKNDSKCTEGPLISLYEMVMESKGKKSPNSKYAKGKVLKQKNPIKRDYDDEFPPLN